MDPEVIAEAHVWLYRAYAHVAETFGEDRLIRASGASQVANAEHHWGIAPFHYVPAGSSLRSQCPVERIAIRGPSECAR